MLAYARRLLALNDQASRAVRGAELEGRVRLGLQEDFGETLLPQVLGQFARAHPKVRLEARVARNADLLERIALAQLDLALAWDHDARLPHAERLLELPMCWIGPAAPAASVFTDDGDVPLVAFEAPCLFRDCATAALARANLSWRAAFTSPSLAGLWAAATAGLGVAVRTPLGLPATVRTLAPGEQGLPALPSISLSLYQAQAQPDPVAAALGDIVRQCIHDSAPRAVAGATRREPLPGTDRVAGRGS
ncbi:hypothetical protein G6F55_013513 [Rhizopus delemar]|nr:hypothetical protein G6F55_013513 [Rhizopus delemar]